jgi:hypothetical protein
MTYLRSALVVAVVAFVMVGGFLAWQVIPELTRDPGQIAVARPGTVGGHRAALLREITAEYAAAEAGVSPKIASGDQLAPEAFLNKELERRGAKWRVRDVNGIEADIYLVS